MSKRLVVGAVVLALTGGWMPSSGAVEGYEPRVVVAVADTGVNPYHEIYYRPELTEHPCTWVAGYDDCSIPALPLSIGEYDSWEEAVEADRNVWESVELHQWYWIPRTNIIGAVCEQHGGGAVSGATATTRTCILDDGGHGTGTTSSVLMENPDALLLVHEGNSGAYDLATAPVIPDVQSHSWGPAAPLPAHVLEKAFPGGPVICAEPPFHDETLFFLAAGNEAPFPTFLDCSRVYDNVHVVGGGWPGYWHHGSWTAPDFTSWHCRPTADHESITEYRDSSCGTSFAAPTAAGAASKALLDLRRAQGYVSGNTADMVSGTVSQESFVQAMRTTATYDPQAQYANEPRAWALPLPEQAPWAFWGYGWLDSTVSGAVAACAAGTCPAKDPDAVEFNETRRDVRRATYEDAYAWPPQDDAGSGGDAPNGSIGAVPITPGVAYSGFIDGIVTDTGDWYAFDVEAGQTISAVASATVGCYRIHDPTGKELVSTCDDVVFASRVIEATAPVDGTYLFSFGYFVPQDYRFGVGVDGPPPEL